MAEKKSENTTLVNFRIDPVVKESAEAVLAGMGLSTSAYVGMCLRQLAQDRKIPFAATVNADFWMAENKVSEAMGYISTGTFTAACELADEMYGALKIKAHGMLEADGADFSVQNEYGVLDMLIETVSDHYSLLGWYKMIEMAAESWKRNSGLIESVDDEKLMGMMGELRKVISDSCIDFLEEHGLMSDGLNDEDAVELVDGIRFAPIEAYDHYQQAFAMRFASTGSDVSMYWKIEKMSDEMKLMNGGEDFEGIGEMKRSFEEITSLVEDFDDLGKEDE